MSCYRIVGGRPLEGRLTVQGAKNSVLPILAAALLIWNSGILQRNLTAVTVDGEKVEPVKLVGSLIGINVPAGTHTVTMRFWPDYLTLAIIVSLVGLSLIAIVFVLEYKNGKIFRRILAKTK